LDIYHVRALQLDPRHLYASLADEPLGTIGISNAGAICDWLAILPRQRHCVTARRSKYGCIGRSRYLSCLFLQPLLNLICQPGDYSTRALFLNQCGPDHPYFIGKWFEARAKGRSSAAIQQLLQLQPKTALRERPDAEPELVDVAQLQLGDIIHIKPGQQIPTDCVILSGESAVDEAMLTGES